MSTPSVSQRINGERLALAGWSRAILLQMAHPLIAAGVVDHSSFRASPATAARRLKETVSAMLGLTFGTAAEQAHVISRIMAIHRRVRGELREPVGTFEAGTPYSAEDPTLVLWVHTTLVESTMLAYDTLVAPLSADERDAYCAEAAGAAIALGARREAVPMSRIALESSLRSMHASSVLGVGTDARLIARALLSGPFATLAGPVGWSNRLITVGWLPPHVRAMYGFEWTPRDEGRLQRLTRVMRGGRRLTPSWLTQWPAARRERPGAT